MVGAVSLEEALALLDSVVAPGPRRTEEITVAQALRHVLAEEVRSAIDLPPFDKSAMDGFAVSDRSGRWRLVESVPAGVSPTRSLDPGTASRVMTGAPVPPGAVLVLPLEEAEEHGGEVKVRPGATLRSANICSRGEDVLVGAPLLRAGMRLLPVDLANLAAAGVSRIRVALPPTIAILTTGDEVVSRLEERRPASILDANGPLLEHSAARHGLPVVLRRHVPDRMDPMVESFRQALAAADMVLVTGGVSAGDLDLVRPAMEALGLEMHLGEVLLKPGRPFTVGVEPGREKLVFGLPGNPVPVYIWFYLAVLRAVARFQGAEPPTRTIRLPLGEPVSRRSHDRDEIRPARLSREGAVTPVESHGTAHLLASSAADGFMLLPRGQKRFEAGEAVDLLLLR